MGNFVRGLHAYNDPDAWPKTHMPPVFDPLYGFPQGRKKREMKVSEEEMTKWGLDYGDRDYCAHLYVEFKKCQQANRPMKIALNCHHIKHAWETCQLDDQILRMKEYERERRLLAKERRLKQKQESTEKEMEAA